jgi:hypothetical protein
MEVSQLGNVGQVGEECGVDVLGGEGMLDRGAGQGTLAFGVVFGQIIGVIGQVEWVFVGNLGYLRLDMLLLLLPLALEELLQNYLRLLYATLFLLKSWLN